MPRASRATRIASPMSRGLRTSTVLRATVTRLRPCENIRTTSTVRISTHRRLCEFPHTYLVKRRERSRTSARRRLGEADQDIQAQVFLTEVLDVLAHHDLDAAVPGCKGMK